MTFTLTGVQAAEARGSGHAFLTLGERADAPSGFLEMCASDAALCGLTGTSAIRPRTLCAATARCASAQLTRDGVQHPYFSSGALADHALGSHGSPQVADGSTLWPIVQAVNQRVNRRTRQRLDIANFGIDELWRPSGDGPNASGDCEDLALQKRVELLAAGAPAERLFLAVVFRSGVGLHTVLVVRSDEGDFVLDSRSSRIVRWDGTPYRWLRVQSAHDPLEWRRVALT